MASLHEQFSEQFRRWEKRGRGWQVFPEPVEPEPPFQPYPGNFSPPETAPDDGLKIRVWNSFFSRPGKSLRAAAPPEPEPEPTPLIRDSLVEWQVSLPANLDIAREACEQFFRHLNQCQEPVAFELLGTAPRVLAQFAACEADASLVRKQLAAYFPDVQFRQQTGTLEKTWLASNGGQVGVLEFGLERKFMYPLATGKLDPFIGIIGALAELRGDEIALFQVLAQAAQQDWPENILRSVTQADGKPFFVSEPELTSAAENKIARPLYAAVVRILVRTATPGRLLEIARELAGSLRAFANPQGNALIPLHNEDYPLEAHIEDVLRRQSRRSGMILNSDELTGFVHLPSSAVRSPALQRDSGRTKAAPAAVCQPPGVVIGDNEHNGETVPVFLTADQRVRHTHIIGSTGTGKSSLLLNLIRQDIENGDGVAVLEPHGDLIDQILGMIPPERMDDVVLVNPSDVEFPIGFNILQAHSEEEKNLLASDLVSVFRRLATSWGDQMDTVLQNAILVFLESSRGGTLADLRRFLLEPPFRTEFLKSVPDPELIYYWQKVFPQLGGGKSIGSVLTRLQDFFSRKPLRNMVSQRDNKLDFADIIRLNDAQKNLTDTEQELAALQRQIQKVRDEMSQTHKLYLEGGITVQGFGQFYKPAEERLNQLLAGLPKLEADFARLKIDQVSVEEVIHEARQLYEQWPNLDVDRKRKIVESIFEKVEIGEGKISISYSGLPSSEELCKSQQQMAPARGCVKTHFSTINPPAHFIKVRHNSFGIVTEIHGNTFYTASRLVRRVVFYHHLSLNHHVPFFQLMRVALLVSAPIKPPSQSMAITSTGDCKTPRALSPFSFMKVR